MAVVAEAWRNLPKEKQEVYKKQALEKKQKMSKIMNKHE